MIYLTIAFFIGVGWIVLRPPSIKKQKDQLKPTKGTEGTDYGTFDGR